MKRGKLSETEVFYIVNNTDKTPEEIAKSLDRSVDAVNKVLSEHVVEEPKVEPEIPEEAEGNTSQVFPGRKLMGRETQQGRKGIAVMTQAASEHLDEFKKKRVNTGGAKDCIHNPYED